MPDEPFHQRQPHRIVVLGAGGGVADMADLVDRAREHGEDIEILGLLDDGVPVGTRVHGHEVVGRLADWSRFRDARFVSTIRNERIHHRHDAILEQLAVPRERWSTLVDRQAVVAADVVLGRGTYVCPGAVVAPNVVIGDQVSIGPNTTVGHDSVVEDFAVIAPGAVIGGRVTVGRACYVGAAAAIMPEVRLGARSLVGMGAVVVRDVDDDHVVAGNPARTLRIREADSSTST